MDAHQPLLQRLDEIGRSLAATGRALALIGLGSVGQETGRLDAYSDLDFFAIVQPGAKDDFIRDLSWLSAPCPLVFAFRNTVDGYKALYADGIFAEFAVFEPDELAQIPRASGRVVWAAEGMAEKLGDLDAPLQVPAPRSPDWLLNEALTNLYVGLGRYRRGEKLSSLRFIQGYAVDRVLELVAARSPARAAGQDPFSPERRFETRFPGVAGLLPAWMPGYDRCPQAAAALLSFLEQNGEVNPALKGRILDLIREGGE